MHISWSGAQAFLEPSEVVQLFEYLWQLRDELGRSEPDVPVIFRLDEKYQAMADAEHTHDREFGSDDDPGLE